MRKINNKYIVLTITILLLATLCAGSALAAAAASRQQIREELLKLLKDEPDIVLDVLRENSEVVLELAQQGAEVRRLKILKAEWEAELTKPKTVRLAGRPVLGQDKAPVTIVAFTDFTCAYCRQGEKTLNSIYESYKGKVRVVYKSLPMPTHPGSMEAAEFMLAAYAQDQNKSWKLFHTFFDNRERILAGDGHAFLRSAVMDAGLNITKVLEAAKSSKVQQLIQEDEQDADKLGLDGTPCFLVNNIVIRGALQENLFRAAVDMALKEAEKKK